MFKTAPESGRKRRTYCPSTKVGGLGLPPPPDGEGSGDGEGLNTYQAPPDNDKNEQHAIIKIAMIRGAFDFLAMK